MKTSKILSFVIVSILSLVGCQGRKPLPQPSFTVEKLLLETFTRTPGMTSTLAPSATMTKSNTIIPARTRKPTATLEPPTWTPLPRLSVGERDKLIQKLIQDNGGCSLPCWWGITPGKTTWREAEAYLSTFMTKILTLRRAGKGVYGVTYHYAPDLDGGATIFAPKGLVEMIQVRVFLPLPDILADYGRPKEVWIRAIGYQPTNEAEFILALYYPEYGFLAPLTGKALKAKELDICPTKIDNGLAWLLWPVGQEMTFEEAGKKLLLLDELSPVQQYYKLEEFANIDLDTFYETYKDKTSNNRCFQIPYLDWPY